MKTKRRKETLNKGITLIALVITIIVLLILAAVSISTLTGENGILTKASTAKENTEREAAKEKVQMAVLASYGTDGTIDVKQLNDNLAKIDGLTYNSFPISENNKITKEELEREEGVTVTVDGYEVTIYRNGTVTVGNESMGGNTPNLPEGDLAKDVLKTDATATEESSKSPYVTYNGLDCRVLYNDDTHGIQIITAESVGDVTLGYGDTEVEASDFTYDGTATVDANFYKAAASYNNVVDNLNKRAKTYMDTKGIATDARCLGSIPTLNSSSKFQGDITSEMWSGTATYLSTYSWNNKFKNTDTNYLEDLQQLNDLGLSVSSRDFWLASREVLFDDVGAGPAVRVAGNGGVAQSSILCEVNVDNRPYSRRKEGGFRPVFLLPSNVVISSGDGSSENPYVIE
ncbi:MAG: hypothetical protein HFJ35_04850 [Clostridia bacterium]|nr:hypothetical protein [Clostridia bacterium]